ncbi:MAG: hypothetical protein HYX92_21815 [Chloroflexi bacterium]|nr:hypothetical protein [Chloroflexota bacterium]
MKTAAVVASASGVSELGIAEYPGAIQLDSDARVRENLEKTVLDRIIAGLTGSAESPTATRAAGRTEEVVFEGDIDGVNAFFYKKGWTDGLGILPPTVERVEEFLEHAGRPPDEGIAVLPQANLIATPRNIAVNAIMAGCRPEFMPLLIFAVEAVGDPEFQLINLGSTGCKTPWLLVNGPIVKQLGIEYGVGLRSRGPNPVLGRALGLILNNIAGFRAGETWMGTWGYYLPFVLAEDEDACAEIGWKPYHVERGFDRGASTVTARSTVYWGGQGTPGGWAARSKAASPANLAPPPASAESILKVACKHVQRNTLTELSLLFGDRNMVAVLFTPPTAKVLASAGYSKRDVAEHIWKNARLTVAEENDVLQGYKGAGLTVHELVEKGTLPKSFDVGPEDTIPMFASADLIDVVVCGDAYRDKLMSLWCNYNRPVTREIRMPQRLADRRD